MSVGGIYVSVPAIALKTTFIRLTICAIGYVRQDTYFHKQYQTTKQYLWSEMLAPNGTYMT